MESLLVFGQHHIVCYNQDGSVAWEERLSNGVTLPGMNAMLESCFAAGTQQTAWYAGIIDSTNFTGLSVDDTMAAHDGWQEYTGYASSDRPQWTPLNVSGGLIRNRTPMRFEFTQAGVVNGLFIVSSPTRGGNTGILWSTGLFGASRAIEAGQQLLSTYTVRMAGGK